MAGYLREVPETEAEGVVAELYEDIRTVVGVRLVNLVYRHLAVEPARLEAAWTQLRPNLTDAAVDEGADDLRRAARLDPIVIPPAALGAVGIGGGELRAVGATLDAYNHANPRNLIALTALLNGVPGGGRPRPAAPTAGTQLLPASDPAELAPPVRKLLDQLAMAFSTPGEAVLVPGLFRHLTAQPALLALFWTAVQPLVAAVARAGEAAAARAAALADALPHRVEATDDVETAVVLRRFTQTIPRMIVVGVAFRSSIEDALATVD